MPDQKTGPSTLGSSAATEAAPGWRVLEKDVSLSQSIIWRLQRDFYAQRGLKAWKEDLVPSYITNNPFIAEIFAGIVAAFVQDCTSSAQRSYQSLSRENPLRVLELGAGTGKFSYLFLRKLIVLLQDQNIPLHLVRYCMTDTAEKLVSEWRENAHLKQLVSSGILEFEVFQAGQEHRPQTKGPLVVIANYVFDSLPQDAFAIEGGGIHEILVTTSAAEDGEIQSLKDLRFSYRNSAVSPQHYPCNAWNGILEQYRSRLSTATVLFPTSALQTLQQLGDSSDGRMLVLAADKGIIHEEDLALVPRDPTLEFHAGGRCSSQLVNFDAIGKYFRAKGGEALVPTRHFTSLNLCAFIQRNPGNEFRGTQKAYREAMAAFGPDDLFAIMSWLNAYLEEISLAQALPLLRLTRWDPVVLARLFPVIARQARNAVAERTDLRDAVLSTWENHYPLNKDENVLAFYCGVILLELRFFQEAYSMFRKSQQLFGPSATTSYNLGLCCVGLGRSREALDLMREACSLDPSFEPARQSRVKLANQIGKDELEPS
ncbi:MAG: SAM-dependent methyltransferase [Candidatus Angelobacter sp.]